jgi:hypothetical protein
MVLGRAAVVARRGYRITAVMSPSRSSTGWNSSLTGIDEVKKQIRYASAWFDWELTKLEGSEC